MNTKDTFIIEGLAGQKKLKGTIKVNGAKNAVLKAMAASVLFEDSVRLENVPETDDIGTMAEILRKLGAKVAKKEPALPEICEDSAACDADVLFIDSASVASTDIDPELAKSMRASIVLTGPLLARFGKASFPAPGGCVIGARPIDLFLKGYEKMGAVVTLQNDLYHIDAKGGLKGADIFFDKQSVGGTETLMMAAVLADGKTVLRNCAMEPEIVSVAEWLKGCDARIRGAGTPTIEVEGTGGRLLKSDGVPYVTLPDRIEAGSFLVLGALCAEDLTIQNCETGHLEAVINLLKDSGVNMEVERCQIRVSNRSGAGAPFKGFNVSTHEYPGFPTDLQPPIVTFLTQAKGQSAILETIFEGRFKFTEDLGKMGADITVMNPREILVKGPSPLSRLPDAEELTAHDIRGGFAVVLAALVGKGKFIVNNVHLIDRGYERLEERLKAIGAKIERKTV